MSDNEPGPAGTASIVDLLGVVPRLVDRTRRQVELAVAVADLAACLRRPGHAQADEPVAAPAAPTEEEAPGDVAPDATEDVDVLSVLAEPGAGSTRREEPEKPRTPSRDGGDATRDAGEASATPPPQVEDLAIEEYDSLSASQVVPRLATLSATELEQIRAYERATRRRQTILNRAAQLLGP